MDINELRERVVRIQRRAETAKKMWPTGSYGLSLTSEIIDYTTAILESLSPKYYVRVPYATAESYYYKTKFGIDVFTARNGRELQPRAQFTEKELFKYGFDQGFDLVKVGDGDDD